MSAKFGAKTKQQSEIISKKLRVEHAFSPRHLPFMAVPDDVTAEKEL
jgi:hypothetical protein